MKRDAKTVSGWDFERIIPCHGVRFSKMLNEPLCLFLLLVTQDVIETNAKQAWNDAYKYFLD